MQELLLDHPYIIGAAGLGLVGLAVLIWIQTAHKAALYSAVGLLAVTAILIFISLQIETDRERIQTIMDAVADAVEANDHERCYSYIHPNSVEGLRRARNELPRYDFSEARITRIKDIMVNNDTTPPTAIAEFNVVVNVEFQGQRVKVPRFIKAYFMKYEDRWLVHDYEHFDPRAGFGNSPLTTPGL